MNILHTEWMGVKGGQSIRVIEDLKIIRELGYTPYLACKPDQWLEEEARKENIMVFPLPFSHISDVRSLYKLYQIIRENNIDIVHTHSSKDSYIATIAGKILGAKVVRSRHIELNKKPGLIYRFADYIVTTGERIKSEFVKSGLDKNKIISIPTYPDETLFHYSESIHNELQEKYQTKNMLVIGAMTGLFIRKRPLILLPIMKKIVAKYPHVKLLIAGQKLDSQIQKFNSMIHEYGIENNVEFVGYVKPEVFLNIVDIYVCPSEKEGVPQSLMQAMMMGKAAVSTDVGSVVDLNIDNNLIIVDKDNLENLENEIIKLVENEKLRNELSNKNYKIMKQYFSRNVMKKKTKEIYQYITSGNQ